ncbi:hypothetical protein LIER_21284 [Lithospermum erythrorhizon]|uniref:Aminotransferase-like plant mobile domain-containing protein n=1 Tax=Lithospermum erythrorhizon TaxID=34254 RepID=A0AAV3QPT2_LITER
MDWSPYSSRSRYCLTSHGSPNPKIPRSLCFLKDEVVVGRASSMAQSRFPGPLDILLAIGSGRKMFLAGSPSTNTLLTDVGEISLSLWDLYKLASLPIKGQILHKVVPSAEYLSPTLPDKERIPESYFFLLQAYHRLSLASAKDLVHITDWINFWSELLWVYVGPQAVSNNRWKASSLARFPKGMVPSHRGITSKLVGPHMAKYGGLYRIKPCDSMTEARGRLNICHPGWTALRPRRQTSFVFLDRKPRSYKDITFFLSLHTNMVGFRFEDQFAVEVYHQHHFSRQFGFAPSIPGISNEVRGTVDIMTGLRLWRICMISCIGQSVQFPYFKEFTSRSKDYQAWLDKVISCGSVSSSPRIPCRGKGLLVLPSSVLKRKASLDNISKDRDPKHARAICLERSGSTRAASHEAFPRSVCDQPMEVSSSLSGSTCTKIVDTCESHAGTEEFIPPHIESIFRDSLRASWVELCSLGEGRSHSLLAEEEIILASFQAFAEFSRQDLTCHGKKLKAIFSKALYIKKVQCKAASSKIHDKFIIARASSEKLSSKLLGRGYWQSPCHLVAVGGQAARLRQELKEMDTHVEALRDQVTSRESVIAGLEPEKSECVLRVASLEET